MSAAVESAPVANPPAESTDNTQSAEVLASAAEGRRLYIGNLAYATTEGELKDFFKEYLVEGVSIPVNPRTTRPVGYAFVDLSTPSEAERAINELNGKNILDRKVSIQLARKPEATPEGGAKSGDESAGKTTRRRLSGRGRGRGRGGRAARGGRKTDDANGTEAAAEATNGTATNAKKGEEAATPADASKPRSPREPRERKQRGPPEDGVPSKTKVMVANLPYDLGEEKLLEIFKEYNPTSAKIALRPIPRFMIKKLQARNEPRKGRGFGFVTLASEEMQQKACAEMNGKEIEGREIAVKVAIDSPGKEDEDPSAESAEATPAAEATQAAPAAA
ncbi:hypothetical protein, variant [Verruconis gallopava]|uniref:RRM domain-containing protein n=1 Tax=Verruconis gallopava TaxID=253628 RepID=A0A0D1YF74_9PEZI|nr:hypothetical protein, variant [Verruconis gallopava]KIV99401.1 hypothetical protein, variant [Verruconis gallopava]